MWTRVRPRPSPSPPAMRSHCDGDRHPRSLCPVSRSPRRHLPPPPRPPDPPRSPPIITRPHAVSILVSAPAPSLPYLGRKPNVTRVAAWNAAAARRARRPHCACAVVHLRRKRPRWRRRQRACVCQPIEQERLEGLLLRGGGAQRGRETEGGGRRGRGDGWQLDAGVTQI